MVDLAAGSCNHIPSTLLAKLTATGINAVRVVEVNPQKGRWVLEVSFGGQRCLVKWNESGEAFAQHRGLLEKEKVFYEQLKETNAVPAVFTWESGLCVEYLENAETLRECALRNNVEDGHLAYMAIIALRKWVELVATLNSDEDAEDAALGCAVGECKEANCYARYRAYLGSLSSSGPLGTESSRFSRFTSKFLKRAFLLFRDGAVKASVLEHACDSAKIMHGDFHLNNVLVTDGGSDAFLVDLENAGWGLPEVELAYFAAQLWAVSGGRLGESAFAVILNEADVFARIAVDRELLKVMWAIMTAAISLNGRFGVNGRRESVIGAIGKWLEANRIAVGAWRRRDGR